MGKEQNGWLALRCCYHLTVVPETPTGPVGWETGERGRMKEMLGKEV